MRKIVYLLLFAACCAFIPVKAQCEEKTKEKFNSSISSDKKSRTINNDGYEVDNLTPKKVEEFSMFKTMALDVVLLEV